jgi:S-DNA-T family DNA segregation ATPase FtsK/SpoIIIE
MLPPPQLHHVDQTYLAQAAQHITARLATYGLNATVAPAHEQGSLVHRFDITAGHGQKIKPIEDRQEDLESHYAGLRFVKRPGSGKLGLEIAVPESHRAPIQMREVLDTPEWLESKAALPIALGVTTSGAPVVIDLATCPHLLVAGTSGAGKSVGLHVMLASLLLKNSPADVQLELIDPKFVEFAAYRGLPHLRGPIANEQADAVELLVDLCAEMDARYRKFVDAGARDIASYNALGRERLPRIVVFIEEYADLTSMNRDAVEAPVCRLAQKARAAGIHVILATQRPSTDVITGVIKANFDGRIAYRVASHQDSQTCLGSSGAQQLMGRGDSLVKVADLNNVATRVHGAYLADPKPICDAWRAQTTSGSSQRQPSDPAPPPARVAVEPANDTACSTVEGSSVEPAAKAAEPAPIAKTSEQSPDHYARAVAYASEHGLVSARKLEEALGVGTKRANQLTARMREAGLIEPGGPNNSYRFTQTQTQPI